MRKRETRKETEKHTIEKGAKDNKSGEEDGDNEHGHTTSVRENRRGVSNALVLILSTFILRGEEGLVHEEGGLELGLLDGVSLDGNV